MNQVTIHLKDPIIIFRDHHIDTTFEVINYKDRITIEGWVDERGPRRIYRYLCRNCNMTGWNSTITGCKIGGSVHWQSKHSRIPLKTWANDVFEKRNMEIDDMAEHNRNG